LLVGLIKVLKDNYNETIELPQKTEQVELDIGNNGNQSTSKGFIQHSHYAILLHVSTKIS
jgi:hypothetical protein